MTREGLSGIATGVSYDQWWNGGNRGVPVRHNIIGLLTEAASVNIASPMFLPRSKLTSPLREGDYVPSHRFPNPWPGGWWRLRDIIDYELAFGRSLLGSLAREPQLWLKLQLEASKRTLELGRTGAPRAWIIPSDNHDPAAVRRLLEVLLPAGVDIRVCEQPVTADGREYPAGSIIIHREQPTGTYVKDLFDIQRYPQGDPPYDVSGWTLPLLLGVRRVEVMEQLEVVGKPVSSVAQATAGFDGDPRITKSTAQTLSSWDSSTWTRLVAHLQTGGRATLVTAGYHEGLFTLFAEGARITSAPKTEKQVTIRSMPRIGLYSPWQGSMDEGWTRYVLDTYKIPYTSVRNEMVRAGDLLDFLDVLIIPSVSASLLDRGRAPGSTPEQYTGGLAPEGAVAVEQFVRQGGTLITLGDSSGWAVNLLKLPLIEVTKGSAAKDFSCPGSVLRGVPVPGDPMTAGLPGSVALFFSRSTAWREMTDKERKEAEPDPKTKMQTLLRYAPTRLLLSGWIAKPEVIAGHAAWVRADCGRGRVHLFGFRPQYRAWSQATFPLLFRAMLVNESPAPWARR